jgi:hypothetical protein
MNRRAGMILVKMWITKEELAELNDKLSDMTRAYLVGDGLPTYMRLVDILKGIYDRGDFLK